jgi:curved DNA-binding protein CbpA
MIGVDPYEVLDLPHNFTLPQLKAAFYTQALKVHPDKGGSKELFQLVTTCFRELFRVSTETGQPRQHDELKKRFEEKDEDMDMGVDTSAFYEGKRFNNTKFQDLFDKVRQPSANDKGYVDEMATETIDAPTVRVTAKNINKQFNKHVAPSKRELAVHKHPDAVGILTKLNYDNLGAGDIDDFSGDNSSLHRLNYMDFKIAHTTSRLIDPNMVHRAGFKTLEALKKHRDAMKLEACPEEQREMELKLSTEEEARDARLKADDTTNLQYWKNIRRQMLASS